MVVYDESAIIVKLMTKIDETKTFIIHKIIIKFLNT